jgi:hypothetical protein
MMSTAIAQERQQERTGLPDFNSYGFAEQAGYTQLVPGDVIHLHLGDLVPADLCLFEGVVESDESDLTGESLAVEKSAGATVYAVSRPRRGEASGEVTATQHTYGETAECQREFHPTIPGRRSVCSALWCCARSHVSKSFQYGTPCICGG